MPQGSAVFKPYLASGLPLGEFYRITVSETASALNTICPVPTNAGALLLQVEDADVRIRTDGTAPTATLGRLLLAGSEYPFNDRDGMVNMKLITMTTNPAHINAIFSKRE